MSYHDKSLDRRQFLLTTGSIPAFSALALAAGRSVALAVDPKDPVASAGPPRWALKELESALTGKDVQVSHCDRPEQAKGDMCVLAAGREAAVSGGYLKNSAAASRPFRKLLDLRRSVRALCRLCWRAGTMSGLGHALLELADQVRYSPTQSPA
jgi:hypothetical protein